MAEPRCVVWLMRHGETEWSAAGRHTGRTDIPLTDAGRRQAEALGRHLASRRFDRVLTSPLRRARETCGLTGFDGVAETEPDLAEMDYGEYEGRTTAEIQAHRPGWTVWSHDLPGGETLDQVGARADRVVAQLVGAGGQVAVFSHGHLLRVLAARWLDLDPASGRRLAMGTAAVSVLGWERDNRVVARWNQSWHLGLEEGP